jgi:hypothetical protein
MTKTVWRCQQEEWFDSPLSSIRSINLSSCILLTDVQTVSWSNQKIVVHHPTIIFLFFYVDVIDISKTQPQSAVDLISAAWNVSRSALPARSSDQTWMINDSIFDGFFFCDESSPPTNHHTWKVRSNRSEELGIVRFRHDRRVLINDALQDRRDLFVNRELRWLLLFRPEREFKPQKDLAKNFLLKKENDNGCVNQTYDTI